MGDTDAAACRVALLDLAATALVQSADLAQFAGRASDSGGGPWTSIAALDEGVPMPVLTTALHSRASSVLCSTSSLHLRSR